MFQDAAQIFDKMGLKSTDMRVYMTALAHKDGLFIAEICSETKIKRSTVYLALKRLMEKSYISKVKVGGRWKYYAESPDTLVSKQELLLEDLKTIAPFLKKLRSSETQTEIKFFEGIDGIRKAYESLLITMKFTENQEERDLLAFASGADMSNVFTNWQTQFIDKRKRLGSHYKIIGPSKSAQQKHFNTDPKELREARTIPEDQLFFKVALEICGDSVFIYSPKPPVGGVLIRNKNIADSLRSLFYFVWNNLV